MESLSDVAEYIINIVKTDLRISKDRPLRFPEPSLEMLRSVFSFFLDHF